MKKYLQRQSLLFPFLLMVCLCGCGAEKPRPGELRPAGLVTIDFAPGGTPSVNGLPCTAAGVAGKIAQVTGGRPKAEVMITIGEVAPDVLFETVLRVLDRLDQAGYATVSISLPGGTPYNR